jgi:hypothetical protein
MPVDRGVAASAALQRTSASSPPSLVDAYRSWLRQHPTLVSSLESGLTTLTYLLPDRFGGSSELLYESLNAACGLLRTWHDHLLRDEHAPGAALHMLISALHQVRSYFLMPLRAICWHVMNTYMPVLCTD